MSRELVEVYADWHPIDTPILLGLLTFSDSSRGGVSSFAYDNVFLALPYCLQIDPLLSLHSGGDVGLSSALGLTAVSASWLTQRCNEPLIHTFMRVK
jgi:hypothetical protein